MSLADKAIAALDDLAEHEPADPAYEAARLRVVDVIIAMQAEIDARPGPEDVQMLRERVDEAEAAEFAANDAEGRLLQLQRRIGKLRKAHTEARLEIAAFMGRAEGAINEHWRYNGVWTRPLADGHSLEVRRGWWMLRGEPNKVSAPYQPEGPVLEEGPHWVNTFRENMRAAEVVAKGQRLL